MFASILTYFTASTAKYWAIGIGALAALGMITYLYWSVTSMSSENARLTADIAAKTLVIKSQNETILHQKALLKLQQAATLKLQGDLSKIDAEQDATEDWLNSPEAQKSNRESSEILKKTFEKLGE